MNRICLFSLSAFQTQFSYNRALKKYQVARIQRNTFSPTGLKPEMKNCFAAVLSCSETPEPCLKTIGSQVSIRVNLYLQRPFEISRLHSLIEVEFVPESIICVNS